MNLPSRVVVSLLAIAVIAGDSEARADVNCTPANPPTIRFSNTYVPSCGGPVMTNLVLVRVLWGNAASDAEPHLEQDMLDTGYMSLLSQYGVKSGRAGAHVRITPTAVAPLDQNSVAQELTRQMAAGVVPRPVDDTLYVVVMPPAVDVTSICGANDLGCHIHPSGLRIAVVWDANALGTDGFGVVESHEIAEAASDPDASAWGEPDPVAYGLGEIGDLCNGEPGHIDVSSPTGLRISTVQKIWSEQDHACMAGPNAFTKIPGCANAIGSGGPTAWVLGCSAGPDFDLYQFNFTKFVLIATNAGRAIAVSPGGPPWVVNSAGNVLRYNFTSRKLEPTVNQVPCARTIGVASNDQAWITDCNDRIYQYSGGGLNGTWTQVSGSATKISVQDVGAPWVINSAGQIYAWDSTTSKFIPPATNTDPTDFPNGLPGCATDIAVTSAGRYIIGCQADANKAIYQLRATYPNWDQITGGFAAKIAVTLDGTPWVVDASGGIWTMKRFGTGCVSCVSAPFPKAP